MDEKDSQPKKILKRIKRQENYKQKNKFRPSFKIKGWIFQEQKAYQNIP